MWDLIINPFITILTLLYSVLGGNIVLAIAVFTVAIRILTSPLLIQQQRSAKAMQDMQPKLNELKEKYKNDREKLSQAQMELYKQEGINPLGGCLPLLIQLPILLGLYQAIIHALAGTPFQLIDLSGRLLLPGLDHLVPLNNMWAGMDLTLPPTTNPQYAMLFPLLVLATTWLQSKLTLPAPPPADEGGEVNQAAAMTRSMTTIMPLMFGFFSLSFSVGLSIYFVVGNLVGIAQYTMMGKADWAGLLGRKAEEATKTVKGTASKPVINETARQVVGSGQKAVVEAEPANKTASKKRKDKKMRKVSQ